MRDYLEELLEEWAEGGDGETMELPPSAVRTAPAGREPREYGEQMPTGDGETHENTLSVGFAASSPEGGAEGAKRVKPLVLWDAWESTRKAGATGAAGQTHSARPYGSAETLVGKLRRSAMAAAYRATVPHTAQADVAVPAGGARMRDVAELDAAVRRDARRYDGGFELY